MNRFLEQSSNVPSPLEKFKLIHPFKASAEAVEETDLVMKLTLLSNADVNLFITSAKPIDEKSFVYYWGKCVCPNLFQVLISVKSREGVNMLRFSRTYGSYKSLLEESDDLFKYLSDKVIYLLIDESLSQESALSGSNLGFNPSQLKNEITKYDSNLLNNDVDFHGRIKEVFRVDSQSLPSVAPNPFLVINLHSTL